MKFSLATALAAVTVIGAASAADLDPIVIKGNKFFYKTNGTEFYIRGVAYQADVTNSTSDETFSDPLADADGCKRDIPYLQELGTNTIRVYAIDTTKDHTDCMTMLQDAGIYVVSDLSEPSLSINRDDPEWNAELYDRYTSVVDALANYTNVIGFFAGNEVSNNVTNTNASPFVKAAVRDTKAYIKAKGYRSIPVGYATNDDSDIRVDIAAYFDCGDSDSAVDFWGYNIYSWCGDSSFSESGYDERTKQFEDYDIPVFFAEYGCNSVSPRPFTEVQALYGSEMTDVWSGGIVYMYFQEANDYGLVTVSGDSVSTLSDYKNLKSQLAKISPSSTNSASYTPTNTKAQSCPTTGSDWNAATALPPSPNTELCSCMMKSLSCAAVSDISDSKISELYGFICGADSSACTGITGNGTSGIYGAYSMCNSTERLSFAMNEYYLNNDKSADACSFSGSGQTQSAATATSCASLLKQAASGTGTVTSSPSVTGSSSGGSSASSTGSSDAAGTPVPSIQVGMFKVGAAMIIAVFGGAAIVFM